MRKIHAGHPPGRTARPPGRAVRVLREPGGTPIGEEIRHTLKHSPQNVAMTAEAELMLMNASRATGPRSIRPALAAGNMLCVTAFTTPPRLSGLWAPADLSAVKMIIDFAVGDTRPDLTSSFKFLPKSVSNASAPGSPPSPSSGTGSKKPIRHFPPGRPRVCRLGRRRTRPDSDHQRRRLG